jgi:DNA-binding MarR family transcriptional regulator
MKINNATAKEDNNRREASDRNLVRLYPLLQKLLAKISAARTRSAGFLGLTDLQTAALGVVCQAESLTMKEMARQMLILQPAVTRIADELENRRLVKRIADRADRRVTRLRATPEGRRALEEIRKESRSMLAIVTSRMDNRQQSALVSGLEAFIGAVDAAEKEYLRTCQNPVCADLREAVKEKSGNDK